MIIFSFDQSVSKRITRFDSNFAMSRVIQTTKPAHVGCMYLEENGVIGWHQAVTPQLLLILQGEGLVKGADEVYAKVSAGDAVFWEKGEWHETKTEAGLTAIVMESEELDPGLFMSVRTD
ncbi:cupin domain-containing protein [Mangrovibacillus cuniculi]|uniref:Cupin domain-containing protein n=1 Tax=Mangrovibacillus cuniculi TaxID=2593652 RepID=A0A7S8C9W6_9BACI|nr:cupin domain-containing protein [Mangrovibacillus cuniculi]QPC45883.1 cupin domain-containing protein [Mangrovibacillus cuniculi]